MNYFKQLETLDMATEALEQSESCEEGKGCSNCVYSGRPTYKSPCSECRDNSQWEMKQFEPYEDTISRQAAIDALMAEPLKWDDSSVWESARCHQWMMDMDVIKALPSAQPEKVCVANITLTDEQVKEAVEKAKNAVISVIKPDPQWIPCSKTIDIPDHQVLCCDKHGEELIGWLSYNDVQWFCESNGEIMYDTIAWREKPEPYGGELE